MKRDWDVIRQVLLTVEEADNGQHLGPDALGEPNKALLFQHVHLLTEAGYLEAKLMHDRQRGMGGGDFVIVRMTWAGHDLLAAIRSQPVWERVKALAKEKGLSLGFEVIKSLVPLAIKHLVGSP